MPSECPGSDTECQTRVCNENGSCGLDLEPLGTPCAGGVCDGKGYCVDSKCLDGKWSAGETDVDCGGPKCAPCDKGKLCKTASDCESGFCADERCCDQACDGGCGKCDVDGKEGACSPLDKDTECRAAQGDCDLPEECDGQKKDCPVDGFIADGKPSTGNKCDPYLCDGKAATCASACAGHDDCVGGYWCVGLNCALPKCDDKVKDGQETDVDCGGPSCPGCGLGKACSQGSDCASGACTAGKCTECTPGAKDCLGSVPRTCDPGGSWQTGPACQGATPFCCAGSCVGGVVEVAAGSYHTCAVKAGGSLWCWGYNLFGALGDGTTQDKISPVHVTALGGCK
ncbi:MAG: hypothetical protein HY744_18435 [Deltaproteobacteria bacterium]|nr:hypothetical protein [Deltaproteobacteria bacterium]